VEGPHSQDICYATENRQVAVKAVAPLTDLLLVVGSRNSSNSQRLVEVCRNEGRPAYLVDDEADVKADWLAGVNTVSITAGASAPEHLVERLIAYLQSQGYADLETLEVKEEDVRFSLPAELNASRLTQIRAAL
jgi:4-hydroxy-3-methylbut-2-enyl diphosphate reductase